MSAMKKGQATGSAAPDAPPAAGTNATEGGSLVAEITSRHGKSTQPESKQMMAVLRALIDVIKAEGLPVSPASLFAACMSAMQRIETLESPQVGAEVGLTVSVTRAQNLYKLACIAG